jgi:hypothetical protein
MFAALNSFQTGGAVPVYVSEVFSTNLYTGTQATQTITNGIDLSTKGGMVWLKNRSAAYPHAIIDSARGLTNGNILSSNSTSGAQTSSPANTAGISAFNTNGFTLRSDASEFGTNWGLFDNYVGWTFRKQPKFFDVVTWTGDGANRTIPHNLGSVPGCIMVKRTDSTAQDWNVYHQSIGNTFRTILNFTVQPADIGTACWNATNPTSTVFSLGTNSGVNASGGTYVAYLFAHDAGGFGLSGTDNIISCGSATVVSNSATVTLGYQPQFVLFKSVSSTPENWFIVDSQRGFPVSGLDNLLCPNLSNQEGTGYYISPTLTGFNFTGAPNYTYIYIAIKAS